MITAIIRNKENTLVLELPHSIYDIYEKLQSIGIMQPPKQIPLTDNEDEDIGVKLFSESDFGQHLLLTLNEKNTIADANMLTLVIGAASEDIKEELEQNVLYDQYDSMDEVISAVRQMTQDAGPVKAVFFCPLVGNIDEGDGDMFTVGDSYLADSVDEIADALKRYTANDENDMAAYYNKDDGVSEKADLGCMVGGAAQRQAVPDELIAASRKRSRQRKRKLSGTGLRDSAQTASAKASSSSPLIRWTASCSSPSGTAAMTTP